jgi:peptidoglycan/LPS O-acetylase OafA/YrhL
VAALSVVAYHLGVVFWTRQEAAAEIGRAPALWAGDAGAPIWARAMTSLPDLGAFGVGLFFLLSGFVIALSLERASRVGFLVGRLLRILPTYAAGYLVSCAVIAAMGDPRAELSTFEIARGLVPGFGLLLGRPAPPDGVSWTLIIEFVFYACCLIAGRRVWAGWGTSALIAGACAAAHLAFVPRPLGQPWSGPIYVALLAAPFLPLMLAGSALAAWRLGATGARAAAARAGGLGALSLAMIQTSSTMPREWLYTAGYLAALAVFALVATLGRGWRPGRAARFAARVSYPLYVVHPVLGYALAWRLSAAGLPASLTACLAPAAALGAAILLHRAIETPSHRLGRALARRL